MGRKPKEKNAELGQRIRELRKKHFPDQAALARYLHVKRSSVSAWELGVSSPPAHVWLRLTPLMDNIQDIFRAFAEAGVSPGVITGAAQSMGKQLWAPAREGETTPVRPYRFAEKGGEGAGPALPFAAEFIPNPLSVRYFVIDEHSCGYGLEIGDILVLDVSQASSLDLKPFWNEVVLLECDMKRISPSEGVQQIAGPLIGWTIVVGSYSDPKVTCSGVLELWPSAYIKAREEFEDLIRKERQGDRDIAFTVGEPTGSAVAGVEPYQETEETEETEAVDWLQGIKPEFRESVLSQVRLLPHFRILGRVIGWFRPPAVKAKEKIK